MTPLFLSSEQIKAEARRLGFSACGLAPAEPLPADYADVLRRWLDEMGAIHLCETEIPRGDVGPCDA